MGSRSGRVVLLALVLTAISAPFVSGNSASPVPTDLPSLAGTWPTGQQLIDALADEGYVWTTDEATGTTTGMLAGVPVVAIAAPLDASSRVLVVEVMREMDPAAEGWLAIALQVPPLAGTVRTDRLDGRAGSMTLTTYLDDGRMTLSFDPAMVAASPRSTVLIGEPQGSTVTRIVARISCTAPSHRAPSTNEATAVMSQVPTGRWTLGPAKKPR